MNWVHWRQDAYGDDLALHYFRDRDGREVDFVVTDRREPSLLVECKLSDGGPARGLKYLAGKFPKAEAWQIAATGRKRYKTPAGIRVAPAEVFLSGLV
ncbi:MAG: hypothetical protein F4X96_02020 [Gammaproteobacteria bacterium]|nr:hypothetical protein [Gammaproteobacteria bacterium]